jgi:hypothetical protein
VTVARHEIPSPFASVYLGLDVDACEEALLEAGINVVDP